ncbi:RNA polymerase II-associated protein 3-like isoform X2 [Oculina patagonica]
MADALKVQLGIRQNAEELQDILKDLDSWQDNMKVKDEELRHSKIITKKSLPPVRNQTKKKKKKKKELSEDTAKDNKPKEKTRISSYDYRSWDKFDVDKVLKDMDDQDEMKTFSSSEDESDETDEDIENERRLQRALLEKDKGNALFKEGKYEEAINCYTTGIQLDPTNAVLPANRAMCLLKLQRYGAAEADCNQALSLDGSYTKAYLRRGAARFQLGRIQEAEADYREVLALEPSNKQAQEELKNIIKLLNKSGKPAETEEQLHKDEASRKSPAKSKPLKRIVIEEIGTESESDHEDESNKVFTKAQVTASLSTEEKRADHPNQAVFTDISNQAENFKAESKDNPCKVSPSSSSSLPSSARVQTPSSKTQSQSTCKTFTVPKTSGQFQADWRALQKEPEQLFHYFRKINPESYPKLFQQSLESDTLVKITKLLQDFYISNGIPVYKELRYLAEVKRFSMAVMFLSDKDKKVISGLLHHVRENKEVLKLSEEDVHNLAKKYGVS